MIPFLVCLLCLVLLLSCGKKETSPVSSNYPESFSFFSIGANTILTERLLDSLESQLGDEAVATRNVINLEINEEGFLQEFFPRLDTLNRQLNSSAGERVEHNTIQLSYRYMERRNPPFDFAEILFSGITRKPLRMRILSRRDGPDILDALREKYGDARVIDWGGPIEETHYWEKNGDLLVFSILPDQFDEPRYEIHIFYVNSLEELVDREAKQELRQEKTEENALKNVF